MGTPCGLGPEQLCLPLLRALGVISTGSRHLNPKPTLSTHLELQIPWTHMAIPSRAQVRTDQSSLQSSCKFWIFFPQCNIWRHPRMSAIHGNVIQFPASVPKFLLRPCPLLLTLRLHSPSPSPRQHEQQPLPSPFYFKSSPCCWPLENPPFFVAIIIISNIIITAVIEPLYYMQVLF